MRPGSLADDEEGGIDRDAAVADLRLAVNRNYTTQGGEKREETCFLTCVVWGKQAEVLHDYLKKGRQIFLEDARVRF